MTNDSFTTETGFGPVDVFTNDGTHFAVRSHTGSGHYEHPNPIVLNGVAYSLWFNLCATGCCEAPGYLNHPPRIGFKVTYIGLSRVESFKVSDYTPAAWKAVREKIIPTIMDRIADATNFVAAGKARGKREAIARAEGEVAELETKLTEARAKLAGLQGGTA